MKTKMIVLTILIGVLGGRAQNLQIPHYTIVPIENYSTYRDAQILNVDSTLVQMKQDILGTWVLEDSNPEYKLEFTNSQCKLYVDGILKSTDTYSIDKNSCGTYSADNSYFLKRINSYQDIGCMEISNLTNEVMSLMIIDKGKILPYHKQP